MRNKLFISCLVFTILTPSLTLAGDLQLVWSCARTPDGKSAVYSTRFGEQDGVVKEKRLVVAKNEGRFLPVPGHTDRIHCIDEPIPSQRSSKTTPGLGPKIVLIEESEKRDLVSNVDFLQEISGPAPFDCVLSQSERYIAFTSSKRIPYRSAKGLQYSDLSSRGVFLLDLRSNAVREVIPFGYRCEAPVFSPDDKLIAFYRAPLDICTVPGGADSNDAFGHRLCAVPAEGGEVKILSPPSNTIRTGMGDDSPPCWSPDGTKILFVAMYNDPTPVIPPVDVNNPDSPVTEQRPRMIPPGVYMFDLTTQKMERLTPTEWASSPSWASDGKRFVCILNGELTVVDSVTKALTPLGHRASARCKWAPRGNLIAFDERPGSSDIADSLSIISADGTHYTVLGSQLQHLGRFFWCD
jgi:hypothetical protein